MKVHKKIYKEDAPAVITPSKSNPVSPFLGNIWSDDSRAMVHIFRYTFRTLLTLLSLWQFNVCLVELNFLNLCLSETKPSLLGGPVLWLRNNITDKTFNLALIQYWLILFNYMGGGWDVIKDLQHALLYLFLRFCHIADVTLSEHILFLLRGIFSIFSKSCLDS